ncbi:hypothetical protein [Microbacterium arabinogalactanolyticum]|nr:hypothetical protein [Microbacterium arabinogalactanolyticum]
MEIENAKNLEVDIIPANAHTRAVRTGVLDDAVPCDGVIDR